VKSNASIEPTEKVCLWLGANVMAEYDTTEAETLLASQRDQAKTSISEVDENLRFLKTQITTTEVNLARVFNHDVKVRRGLKAKEDREKASNPDVD
jgi:prefoldin subunit 5